MRMSGDARRSEAIPLSSFTHKAEAVQLWRKRR